MINSSFQGINRLFALKYSDGTVRTGNIRYPLPNLKTKNYNLMVDGKNVFDLPVKSDMRTYNNIQKIATGQEDDYTTGCLLDYLYFKDHYKMITINLSKQQAL